MYSRKAVAKLIGCSTWEIFMMCKRVPIPPSVYKGEGKGDHSLWGDADLPLFRELYKIYRAEQRIRVRRDALREKIKRHVSVPTSLAAA